ncbi:hypothetical protein KV564_26745 [Paenibacillus chitinolyticus]|nr:hypothetical protein [Paenibacillus chitinolyticus]
MFFNKHPFKTLHDFDGKEIKFTWPEAREHMVIGRIIAHHHAMGGYFFLKLRNSFAQIYAGEKLGWVHTDLEEYNADYEQASKYNIEHRKWIVTDLKDEWLE